MYETTSNHANAVSYHASSNTFIISDLSLDGFVRITRAGELLWQLGGGNPKGNVFELGRANFLGNVQRLANGNTIITSFWGEVLEVTPSQEIVQRFQVRMEDGDIASFGYGRFRESLYGPPVETWAN